MGESVGQDKSDTEELPQYILGIVVVSRVILSGVATLGVMRIVNPFVGVPVFPTPEGSGIVLIEWMVMFAIIGFVVVGVGFPLWMRLSWLIATPFSSTLREEAWEAIQDDESYKEKLEREK